MPKWLFLVGIFLCNFLFAQSNDVRRIAEELCSPKYNGRGYVNKGDSLASVFIEHEFEMIGLKKKKRTYFQSFFHDVNTFPGAMQLVSGTDTLVPGIDYLVDPSCPSFNGTLKLARISYKMAMNQEQLQNELVALLKGKVYNAIVLDYRNCPNDTLKQLAGLTQTLAGVLPVFEWTDKKLTWSVASELLKYPLIQVYAGSKFSEEQQLSVHIEAKLLSNYESRNVFGYLPATKKSKKTVIVSAHYDHLGRMGADTYFPGGNDNASGTATLVEMAKQLKGLDRKVNYLFIAFAGEEAGLVGSKYYVEHPIIPLPKTRFVLNLDIMGSGEEGITVVNATLFPKEMEALQKINVREKLLTQIKPRGPAANSDHYWFTQAGVPAFFVYTMGPNKNYHDIFDTYSNLSFQETNDLLKLLLEFVRTIEE
jgi:hypothetical protein